MKKIIALVLAVMLLVTCLVACGGKFTCDMCGEEKSGKKHEESMLGESIVICDDCYKALEDLAGALG